jgi:hypothetical protein
MNEWMKEGRKEGLTSPGSGFPNKNLQALLISLLRDTTMLTGMQICLL